MKISFVFPLQEVSCKYADVECNMDHVQVSVLMDTVYKYASYIPSCACLNLNL